MMRDRFRVTVIAPKRLARYQLKIVDTRTNESRTQMTTVERGRRNRRRADREAAELQQLLNAGAGCLPSRVTWDQFRDRVEADFLPGRAASTQAAYSGILNSYENRNKPALMRDVDSAALKSYCIRLRKEGYPEATVQKHVRHLRGVFNWACSEGLLTEVPSKPPQPPERRGEAMKAKGRPLSRDEVKAYIDAIPKVFSGEREDQIRQLVSGILVTGFRLGDALRATWDQTGDVFPLFRVGREPVWFFTDAQKNRRDEEIAMLSSCIDFLSKTPESQRVGWIFRLEGATGRLTETSVSKMLTKVGKASGVLVAPPSLRTGKPKYASAHDLRRTFGQEWSLKVVPAILKHLMRHRSHLTTDRFYLGAGAQEVAAHLNRPGPGVSD